MYACRDPVVLLTQSPAIQRRVFRSYASGANRNTLKQMQLQPSYPTHDLGCCKLRWSTRKRCIYDDMRSRCATRFVHLRRSARLLEDAWFHANKGLLTIGELGLLALRFLGGLVLILVRVVTPLVEQLRLLPHIRPGNFRRSVALSFTGGSGCLCRAFLPLTPELGSKSIRTFLLRIFSLGHDHEITRITRQSLQCLSRKSPL